MLSICLLFFFCVGPCFHPLHAQVFKDTAFISRAQDGLDLMYNMEFSRAHKAFEKLKTDYPSEPAPHFLNALCTWWKLSIARDFTGFDRPFLNEIDSALLKAEKVSKKSEHRMEYAFMMFNALAFKARYYAMREQWVTAANTARKALPFLMEGRKYLNETHEFHFAVGLYDYFAVYYPEKYPVTKPLMIFFPSGNKANGIKLLQQATRTQNFSANEARFFLMRILTNDEPEPADALKIAVDLNARYPNNTIYQLYLAKLYFLNREYLQAKRLLQAMEATHEKARQKVKGRIDQIHSLCTSQIMLEVWYYLGSIQQDYHQNAALALMHYRKAEAMMAMVYEKDDAILADLMLRTGKCLEISGRRASAIEYYKKALKYAASGSPEHTEAGKCIKAPCAGL
jgi:tetratricopeptide (TPR) repeat protein